MLKFSLCRLALTLSLIGASTLPAAAEALQTGISNTQYPLPPHAVTFPQTTALLVSFPSEIVADVGAEESVPLTLPLAQPLFDAYGRAIVPANTPISLRILPHKDGALLVTESIVVNGQYVPLQAQSHFIPGQTITRATAQQMAKTNSAVFGNLSTSLAGAAGADLPTLQRAGFAGAAFGILSGLSSPDELRIVRIAPGSVHTLALQMPLTLFSAPPTASLPTSSQAAPAASEFSFRNSIEYEDYLDGLIRAYENGEVSQEDARIRVEAADSFARSEWGISPLPGIRSRIAQHFGYTYAIDRDRLASAILNR
ncbi:MAG: hypothetical protein AB4050_19370 [Synechococcus sp.]